MGRATLLGAVFGGGIGLLAGKSQEALTDCVANGMLGLAGLALFIVMATLFIDPDRLA